ncbi:MAG TPA: glycosyltransferase family 2 protein [Candidatus Omnitrophota bacterium]|nr:glycosyltransferase family 2 protein [Candidatus Omnitrophota bacterium]
MCDIVLLVYDKPDYTRACVESILANTEAPYRLIIVDNGSVQDETKKYLASIEAAHRPRVYVVRIEKNQGYVNAVNLGLARTSAEFVCVISNDTVVFPGWLGEVIRIAQKDASIGIVNPLWELPKGYHGSRESYFASVVKRNRGLYIESDWARGFCFLVKRAVIDKIGGLDTAFAPAYYDDWDYSVRAIRAGFICVCALGAFVWHHRSVTYKSILGAQKLNEAVGEKAKVFCKRWGRPLKLLCVFGNIEDACVLKARQTVIHLLRDQHRVVFVQKKPDVHIQHTNCHNKLFPPSLFVASIFILILSNALRGRNRRFSLIIADEKTASLLAKIGVVRRNYKITSINASFDNVQKMFDMVDRIKKFE